MKPYSWAFSRQSGRSVILTLSIGISHPLNEKRCRCATLHSALFGNRFTKTATGNSSSGRRFWCHCRLRYGHGAAWLGCAIVFTGRVGIFTVSRAGRVFRGEQRLLCKSRAAAHQTSHHVTAISGIQKLPLDCWACAWFSAPCQPGLVPAGTDLHQIQQHSLHGWRISAQYVRLLSAHCCTRWYIRRFCLGLQLNSRQHFDRETLFHHSFHSQPA